MKMLNFKPGCSSEGRCYTTLANSQNRKNVRENPCLCIHAGSRMRSFQFSHTEIFLSFDYYCCLKLTVSGEMQFETFELHFSLDSQF